MDIGLFSLSHRQATNADIPIIVELANAHPDNIWVRDLFRGGSPFPLSDVARGPYTLSQEDNFFVMSGTDNATMHPAKLRIRGDIVEVMNDRFLKWAGPSMDGIRLFVPLT